MELDFLAVAHIANMIVWNGRAVLDAENVGIANLVVKRRTGNLATNKIVVADSYFKLFYHDTGR